MRYHTTSYIYTFYNYFQYCDGRNYYNCYIHKFYNYYSHDYYSSMARLNRASHTSAIKTIILVSRSLICFIIVLMHIFLVLITYHQLSLRIGDWPSAFTPLFVRILQICPSYHYMRSGVWITKTFVSRTTFRLGFDVLAPWPTWLPSRNGQPDNIHSLYRSPSNYPHHYYFNIYSISSYLHYDYAVDIYSILAWLYTAYIYIRTFTPWNHSSCVLGHIPPLSKYPLVLNIPYSQLDCTGTREYPISLFLHTCLFVDYDLLATVSWLRISATRPMCCTLGTLFYTNSHTFPRISISRFVYCLGL